MSRNAIDTGTKITTGNVKLSHSGWPLFGSTTTSLKPRCCYGRSLIFRQGRSSEWRYYRVFSAVTILLILQINEPERWGHDFTHKMGANVSGFFESLLVIFLSFQLPEWSESFIVALLAIDHNGIHVWVQVDWAIVVMICW